MSPPAVLSELEATAETQAWARQLSQVYEKTMNSDANGNLVRWVEAMESLPELRPEAVHLNRGAVEAEGKLGAPERDILRTALMGLHPWRKGPFRLFGLHLDCEWRSDWKWERLSSHLDLKGKDILDVGCGNGYYGWRMLGEGARRVIGLDPNPLYHLQYRALERYLGPSSNYVLPGSDMTLPEGLFETVLSMGVLYHRRSPIDHLSSLGKALKRGGELILETLVLEGDGSQVLVPESRYAKMRNVWFIPTVSGLKRWLERCRFEGVELLDLTATTVEEQRSTEWMRFESLADFLDPEDPARTIEGYPAPVRAMVRARKS